MSRKHEGKRATKDDVAVNGTGIYSGGVKADGKPDMRYKGWKDVKMRKDGYPKGSSFKYNEYNYLEAKYGDRRRKLHDGKGVNTYDKATTETGHLEQFVQHHADKVRESGSGDHWGKYHRNENSFLRTTGLGDDDFDHSKDRWKISPYALVPTMQEEEDRDTSLTLASHSINAAILRRAERDSRKERGLPTDEAHDRQEGDRRAAFERAIEDALSASEDMPFEEVLDKFSNFRIF